jgi:hypothetical protein
MYQYKTNGEREIHHAPQSANNHSSDSELDVQRYSNMPIKFIPLDYVRMDVIGVDRNQLNPDLSFIPFLKEGGVIHHEFCKIDEMVLKIYSQSNRMVLSGSLHKYYNKGIHNYNQFDPQKLNETIQRIKSEFGISPQNLHITNLEFGLNLKVDFQVTKLLENLIQHKKVEPTTHKDLKSNEYKQFNHTNYILKVYSKGDHYKLPDQTLRVEIKQINWSSYRLKNEIVTLDDFIKSDKRIFADRLLKCWDEVILFDPFAYANAKNGYEDPSHPQFWRDQDSFKNRMSKKRHKDKLKKYNKEHGRDIQNMVSKLMVETIIKLQGVTNSNFRENRICRVTGCNIENQKKDSFLLSHTGIKKIVETNSELFNWLRFKFLTGKWIDHPVEIQIREIAHNIRNLYFNQIRRNQLIQKSNQLGLNLQDVVL